MATLAESLVSSTSRPLTLRMRPDLIARRQRYHGLTYWVVKEPVSLSYYRFHEEEYAILCMMDGRTSLDDIKNEFETQFTPQKITFQDLLQFVGMLHRSGLVISESAGQGRQLKKRRDEKKWRELMGKLSNVFALRFRGIDPEKLLNWLYKYTWWFFTPQAVFCSIMLGLAALSLVMIQFDVFSARLPAFHEFFGVKNWIFLGITMAVVKVLHEFGHGLSCKHFGGECHELGAMLLVFTPALYCNVSDSWMLPNKYHRAFIGAAGMYVELILASIATFLWWFSEPGLLNHICLSVMFICSVSTVMFNGNPLMRFDGYYILMDLLEIPNLRQKSTEVVKRAWMHYCLGIEQPENPFLPQRNQFWFGLFTVAAVIYRWMIVFSILYFLNSVFEPVGLKRLGQLIALAGFVGLIVQPLVQLYKFVYTPGRMRKVKRLNVSITIAVAVALVASIFVVPLPHAVHCSFEVQPRLAKPVYASVPGAMSGYGVWKLEGVAVRMPERLAFEGTPEATTAVAVSPMVDVRPGNWTVDVAWNSDAGKTSFDASTELSVWDADKNLLGSFPSIPLNTTQLSFQLPPESAKAQFRIEVARLTEPVTLEKFNLVAANEPVKPMKLLADGILVHPGETVQANQLLGQLENLDVEYQYVAALTALADAQAELKSLEDQQLANPNIHLRIAPAEKAVETAREALAERENDLNRLRLTAPTAGVVVPPPPRKDPGSKAQGTLPKWSASPFDQKNKCAWFNTSDLICLVHDPKDGLEASLIIDQADVELVREKDKVRILLDANTHRAFDTTIEGIATHEIKFVQPTMSSQGGGRIDTRSDQSTGMQIPLSASYQANAPLPAEAGEDWQVGVQGQARIYTGWKTIAWRLGRYLSRTFHFEL